jgi:hypothetical protein
VARTGLLLAVSLVQLLAAHDAARAEARLTKGPYLMDASATSIAILFELSEPAAATVELSRGETRVRTIEREPSDFHEVVLDGLDPDTAYDYSVIVPSGRARGRFDTAPPPGEGAIHFLAYGDNRTNAVAHRAVARAMLEVPADFLLNTGDLVADGSDGTDWQQAFGAERLLLRQAPLFPTLGNHELYYEGVGLPSYLRYTRVPRERGGEETYYGFTWGPVRFLVLDSNEDWSDPRLHQRRWLEHELASAEEDATVHHLVVMTHHGPLSSNHHGSHPGMVASGVVELMRERGVSLLLAGHDHAYERGDADGLKYIVTGGGGAPLYRENDPLPWQRTFEASHHFLEIDADAERMRVTVHRLDGTLIERCAFRRGARWSCDVRAPDSARPKPAPDQSTWMISGLAAAGLFVASLWLLRWRRRSAR